MITNQWRDSNLLAVDMCSELRARFDIHQESPRQQTLLLCYWAPYWKAQNWSNFLKLKILFLYSYAYYLKMSASGKLHP
jgi:hypothetical protein